MPNRKIIFVIVEGASDEYALGVILNRIYDLNHVYIHVMHSDITTARNVTAQNIVSKVGDLVRNYAKGKFSKKDFFRIIQITDTDGAFIPDENVVKNPEKTKPYYLTTEIQTLNRDKIIERNHQKGGNLRKLASTARIWGIPYQIYYMSCNLDHALYGKLNCPDEEKEDNAYKFAQKYKNDIPAFLHFISESKFSVSKDYAASWEYIKKDLHSLEALTNLGLCFNSAKADAS